MDEGPTVDVAQSRVLDAQRGQLDEALEVVLSQSSQLPTSVKVQVGQRLKQRKFRSTEVLERVLGQIQVSQLLDGTEHSIGDGPQKVPAQDQRPEHRIFRAIKAD